MFSLTRADSSVWMAKSFMNIDALKFFVFATNQMKVHACSRTHIHFLVLLPPSLLPPSLFLSLARSDGVQAALGLSVLCHVSSLALTHAGGAGTGAWGLRW